MHHQPCVQHSNGACDLPGHCVAVAAGTARIWRTAVEAAAGVASSRTRAGRVNPRRSRGTCPGRCLVSSWRPAGSRQQVSARHVGQARLLCTCSCLLNMKSIAKCISDAEDTAAMPSIACCIAAVLHSRACFTNLHVPQPAMLQVPATS